MATKECPVLPAELWYRALEHIQDEEDLPELWTSHRQVCTTFKKAIEAIMRANHLQMTFISFDLGHYFDDDGYAVPLNSEFVFDHLSEDQSQATFIIKRSDDKYPVDLPRLLKLAVEVRSIEAPQHEIQIHRDINDGPIPGLSVDYERLELTFDWREMYNVFFGEEQIHQRLLSQWAKGQQERATDAGGKMERGELDMFKAIQQAVKEFAAASENARKIARRARIRREYARLDGTEWDADRDGDEAEEYIALEKLKASRSASCWERQSDDEDEETDGVVNAPSDDSDEEEWEDEDGSDIESDIDEE